MIIARDKFDIRVIHHTRTERLIAEVLTKTKDASRFRKALEANVKNAISSPMSVPEIMVEEENGTLVITVSLISANDNLDLSLETIIIGAIEEGIREFVTSPGYQVLLAQYLTEKLDLFKEE